MEKLILCPQPQQLSLSGGFFQFGNNDCILLTLRHKEDLYFTAKRLQSTIRKYSAIHVPLMVDRCGRVRPSVVFEPDTLLEKEAYKLDISPEKIHISYGDGAGAFHAVSTAKQLLIQYGGRLPCLRIYDFPDFKSRGMMLDISRDKIPMQASLYKTVEMMADLKMNQLQLYIEGFSFAYPSYPWVWQNGTPITGEDILELDKYCKDRFIELVPNQNGFGHMGAWLATREFSSLAEKPEGFEHSWDPGKVYPPETLNPFNPGSLELVSAITDDLLPYFTSDLYNVGCDETFELGQGYSKPLCDEKGVGAVYLEYLLKIYEISKPHGKRMLFWGDIVNLHPELIEQLPPDVTALEWGYDWDHPFEKHCEAFNSAGIDYYVCPGTSSWLSLSGRTENMKTNLLSAAVNGKRFRASGYLITDWGDHGHWQQPFVSYPAILYGASLSWSLESNRNLDIASGLNRFIFHDQHDKMGSLMLDLGNYYLKEKKQYRNFVGIAHNFLRDLNDFRTIEGYTAENFDEVEQYVKAIESQLCQVKLSCDDAELLLREFRSTILLIVHGCHHGKLKLMLRDNQMNESAPLLEMMIREIDKLVSDFQSLWLARNRHGGLSNSINRLCEWKRVYSEQLAIDH